MKWGISARLPNQQMTVDETMIRYEGKYSLLRMYMLKKPVRFGMKAWATCRCNFQIRVEF